jgi:hypothetical protein
LKRQVHDHGIPLADRIGCVRRVVAAPLAAPVVLAAEPEAELSEAERASAELAKAFERLARTRFYRHGSVVFENVARLSQLTEDRITPPDQFLKDFYEGRWEGVRATLAQLPPAAGDALYDRILADLTDRYVPLLALDDFVGLADASPSELTAQRIRSLGLVLAAVVPKEQEVWLRNALEKGTRRLGRSAANRLNTGRILMHANFDDLARQYLPASAEAAAIEDDQLRDEILKFLASQEELDAFQQTRIASVWRQQASVLKEAMTDATRAQQAAERLAELLGRAEPGALEPWLEVLVREQPDGALRVASALGRRAAGKTGDKDVLLRTNNLKAQKTLLRSAAALQDIGQPPWQPLAAAMADWWVQEAENTFNVAPSYRASGTPNRSWPSAICWTPPPTGLGWPPWRPRCASGSISVCPGPCWSATATKTPSNRSSRSPVATRRRVCRWPKST